MADAFGFSTSPLSQIPRLAKPKGISPNSPALETEPSNLEKFFDVLNKPGAAEDQVAINLINGDEATKGVGDILGWDSNKSLFRNLDNLVSSNETYQPTGGDVIQSLRGGQAPETSLGKAAQAVGGFALNVLNPADPLNWLGIGELTDTGRAAEMAGKEVPFIKGLLSGDRSILSATTPIAANLAGIDKTLFHAPEAVNQFAGKALEGAGNVISKIPGVKATTDLFRPTFQKLAQYSNQALSGASKIFGGLGGEVGAKAIAKSAKEALAEVTDGAFERLNKPQSDYYKQQGYTPQQIVSKEVRRVREAPIASKQLGSIADEHTKNFLKQIPTQGPTTPKIQALADQMGQGLKQTDKLRKSVGLPSMGEGYFPRFLSDARKQTFADAGIDVTHGERVLKEFTTEQLEHIKTDPVLRGKLYSEYFNGKTKKAQNPHILDILKKADPLAAPIYEDDAIQSYGRHLKNTATEVSTHAALGNILKNPELVRLSPDDIKGSDKVWKPVDIPANFKKVVEKTLHKTPENEIISGEKVTGETPHYQMPNKSMRVLVPADTEHEFRNFVGMLTDADKMNKNFGALSAGWRTLTGIYKKLTLLTPLGGLHTALRDHVGNHFQSYMANAWSAKGNAVASKLVLALKRAGEDPKKFIEEASKLGKEFGLDLGQELSIMKDSNLFEEGITKALFGEEHFNKGERLLGMKAISNMRKVSENFSRIQHYITRRLQGWTPEGAIKDTRKVLYDYVGGLSPFEKKIQNVFPWYSWSRFNIPAMVEATLRHPGKADAWYRAKENIEGAQSNKPDERALDEYVKGDPHIRLSQDKDGKWNYLRVKGYLPIGDLEDVTSMTKFGEFLEGSLSPFIKAPLENNFNQSTFFKTAGNQPAPIEEYPGQTGSFLGMNIGRKDINLLRNIRPLNEVNRLLGSEGKPTLSPFSYGLSSAGVNLVPVDMGRAKQNAQFSFQKQLSNLKMAKKRQEQKGKPTTEVDNLLSSLNQDSYRP